LGAHEKRLLWVPFLLMQPPYSPLGEALSMDERTMPALQLA
jgi:hypothetical protein